MLVWKVMINILKTFLEGQIIIKSLNQLNSPHNISFKTVTQ